MSTGKLIDNKLFFKKLAGGFSLIYQWMDSGNLENALKYKTQTEALLELAEVEECGSIGGFDKGQPRSKSLGDRFEWIAKKNGIDIDKLDSQIVQGIDLSKENRI